MAQKATQSPDPVLRFLSMLVLIGLPAMMTVIDVLTALEHALIHRAWPDEKFWRMMFFAHVMAGGLWMTQIAMLIEEHAQPYKFIGWRKIALNLAQMGIILMGFAMFGGSIVMLAIAQMTEFSN